MFYTYILRCNDDTLYTGYAADLNKRLELHNKGKASKYTRGRLPVQLIHYEIFDNKRDAMVRECQIKALSRTQKLKLVFSE